MKHIDNLILNNLRNIPTELQERKQWIGWKLGEREGKPTKVPLCTNSPTPFRVDVTKPAFYGTYEEAYNKLQSSSELKGIGFVLTEDDPYVIVDFDHVGNLDEEGNFVLESEEVVQWVEKFSSYTEISQSGTGLHIIVKGSIPKALHTQFVEVYSAKRYFCLTGHIYDKHTDIVDAQEALDELFAIHGPKPREKSPQPKNDIHEPSSLPVPVLEGMETLTYGGGDSSDVPDERIIHELKERGFWVVDDTQDRSKVDFAFCCAAAFWTNKNAERMDKLFRQSPRMREKWDTPHYAEGHTYGQETIAKAIESCERTITEWKQEKSLAEARVLDWAEVNAKGRPYPKSVRNMSALLEFKGYALRYNVISKEMELNGERIDFDDFITQWIGTCEQYGLATSTDLVHRLLVSIGRKNSYNPFVEYLQQCYRKYDGQAGYIDDICSCFVLRPEFQPKQHVIYRLVRKWFLQAVNLGFNDGRFAPQGILILHGAQGLGKSRFVRSLLPQSMVLAEQTLDPHNKDDVIRCTSAVITEISEFGRTMKDNDALKQFYTTPRDIYRSPYARTSMEYPRHTSFIGTINDETFLIDRTGERRYWVVPLLSIDTEKLSSIDMQRVWSEAYKAAHIDQEASYLSQEEINEVNTLNRAFQCRSEIEQILLDSLDWGAPESQWRKYTPTELSKDYVFFERKVNPAKLGRLLSVWSQQGRVKKLSGSDSHTKTYLIPPPKPSPSPHHVMA